MTLPNFLIIGAQRSGSSWLHELLASHPEVYMPTRRKELHYFNKYYERGLDWYSGFFPSAEELGRYRAVGEATPTYLYKSGVPERIAGDLPDAKLMVILRNPADRAFSQYMMLMQYDDYRKSFEELLEENRGVFDYGLYGKCLSAYRQHFARDRFCVLVYEQAVNDLQGTKDTVANFLGVEPSAFPADAGRRRVGGSYLPRMRKAYSMAKSAGRWLQKRDLDWPVNLVKRNVKQIFGTRGERPSMPEDTRLRLLEAYRDDMDELERLFDLDVSVWRQPTHNRTRATRHTKPAHWGSNARNG